MSEGLGLDCFKTGKIVKRVAGCKMTDQDLKQVGSDIDSLSSLAGCPDRYKIKGLIGQGGMGMVFHAFDPELSRDLAIKVLTYAGSSEGEAQERFLRESRILAILDHPSIVKIFSYGINTHGNPYCIMEFLQGKSLAQELQDGSFQKQQFLEVFSQVLKGLSHAHANKITHRDIKPSNIMHCTNSDGKPLYKVIDFGIARMETSEGQIGKTLTRTDAILGSPLYMSPEQCRGERGDQLSDIYAVGCVMYQCISGKPPLSGDTPFETMYKHMSETPERLDRQTESAESLRLSSLVAKCLSKSALERPQSADEVIKELNEIFAAGPECIDILHPKAPEGQKNLILFVAAGVIGVLLIFAILFNSMLLIKGPSSKNFGADQPKDKKSAHRIATQKSRLEKWRDPIKSAKSEEQKENYLNVIFALGREQLQSDRIEDYRGAEETYSQGLEFCKNFKTAKMQKKSAAFLALRAKSMSMQNKLAESAQEFDRALALADDDLKIDIYLERCFLDMRQRDFATARKDSSKAIEIFDKGFDENSLGPDIFAKLDHAKQVLDRSACDRSELLNNIAIELRKMEPRSVTEAEEMLRFSNVLAARMAKSRLRPREDKNAAWDYSKLLLKKIDDPKLKAETELLLRKEAHWKG